MVYIIVYWIIGGVIWGIVCNKVIENKGYRENWFWWGFFFEFLAVIVAATKPQVHYSKMENDVDTQYGITLSSFAEEIRAKEYLREGGWKCNSCGTVNPHYKDRCHCGRTKEYNDNETDKKLKKQSSSEQNVDIKTESEKIQLIKKYKELLDMGRITEEEFNKKKESLISDSLIPEENTEDYFIVKKEEINGWKCSNCDTVNSDDAKLCKHCGAIKMRATYKKKIDPKLLDWICPKCNNINKCYIGRCECGTSKSQGKLVKEE